tara:strand:+ start:2073 stop:4097 length:2025 start_codon:yes stop_codon:yes gene_type:complete
MNYQNPQLLYALFAIAIPVIIHLFNFRKFELVYFSSNRFLKDIKEENQKKSRLKNLLILLSRIFAISFLVLAFSKPFIPVENSKISENVFLYIDNSQSMDINFGQGNLLNIAKNKAIDISNAYSNEINFYIVENDFLSNHTISYNSESIKKQIEKIRVSSRQRSCIDIISRINSINKKNNHIYFISDFQKNTFKIDELKKINTQDKISFISVNNNYYNDVPNISIDSLYISDPIFSQNNEIKLSVLISNTSNEEIKNEEILLYLDNVQKSQQYIDLLAKESKEIIFKFINNKKSIIEGEIRSYDLPITFDNNLFFILGNSEKINISTINKENKNIAFSALFKSDSSLFNFNSLETININDNNISKQDAIILNEITEISSGILKSLLSFTSNGGNLIVVPPQDITDFNSYNALLEKLDLNTIKSKKEMKLKINQFSTKHPVYKNVFTKPIDKISYPLSIQYYELNNNKTNTQIIGYANKESFLIEYEYNKGNIYQFSSPLSKKYNNFSEHALFVPTLINLVTSSVLLETPYFILGSDQKIGTKYYTKDNLLRIKNEEIDIIPTIKYKNGIQLLDYNNKIHKNGIYNIIHNNQIVDKVALNYNNDESKISLLSSKNIKEFITENNLNNINFISSKNLKLKKIIQEQHFGKEYWKIAILLSLLFFAIEIFLIKIIKI